MPTKPHIDPLDPFGDHEAKYQTKEIRHSRSRKSRFLFINRTPEKKKKKTNIPLLATIASILIVAIIVLIIVNPFKAPVPPEEENPRVNPTGREASSEYTEELNDPELRAAETEKLQSVRALIAQEDWEYANAIFEVIFPSYLDDCGHYDYYRSAIQLIDNFEGFSKNISRESAEANAYTFLSRCANPSE